MKITSKGQVTIPQNLREMYGFKPNTEVDFVPREGGLQLVRARKFPGRGKQIIERMRGKGTVKMSTDEIMALMRGEP